MKEMYMFRVAQILSCKGERVGGCARVEGLLILVRNSLRRLKKVT
jgi:hypothetical protein